MQKVSAAWKAAHKKNFVPVSSVEIEMNIGDPRAQLSAKAKSNGELDFSNSASLPDNTVKTPRRYATLERNMFLLNGKAALIPEKDVPRDQGYIGDMLAKLDRTYAVTPTITIDFPEVQDGILPGISITWASAYNEWAEAYKVTAYNGDSVVAEQTVEGNTALETIVSIDITGYDRITVEVLRWCLPFRRARIEGIVLGIIKILRGTDIMGFSHDLFVDPMSAELPKAEISFQLRNLNGEYNLDNPKGSFKYLTERQMITARYGYMIDGSVEWIRAGTFFTSEWDAPQNGITMTITARDALEYMSDNYTGPATGSLLDIATAALTQAGLPTMDDGSVRWTLDPELANIQAPADVDLSKTSIAVVLQYVANAGCDVFYQDREGRIHIEPLAEETSDYPIDRFVSFSNSEISLTKQLKAVDVNNGQYILQVSATGETQAVSNPLISAERAPVVAAWARDYLLNRRVLTGEYRADPSLDPLDRAIVQNQYSSSSVLITEIKYSYNGAFRGNYEGTSGA